MFINVIGNNALTGSIPTELGHLKALRSVNVGKNNLTGTIPIELGNLSEMLYLGLGKRRTFTLYRNFYI